MLQCAAADEVEMHMLYGCAHQAFPNVHGAPPTFFLLLVLIDFVETFKKDEV